MMRVVVADMRLTATSQVIYWSGLVGDRYGDGQWGESMRLHVAQGLLVAQVRALANLLPSGLAWEPLSGAIMGIGDVGDELWQLMDQARAEALASLVDVEINSAGALRKLAATRGDVVRRVPSQVSTCARKVNNRDQDGATPATCDDAVCNCGSQVSTCAGKLQTLRRGVSLRKWILVSLRAYEPSSPSGCPMSRT